MSEFFLISDSGDQILLDGNKTLGRGSSCDIQVDDDQVSREHARLELSAEGVKLIDLQSANGTFVGDNRIAKFCILEQGDIVKFGPRKYTFRISSPETASAGDETSVMSADEVMRALEDDSEPESGGEGDGVQGSIVVLPRNRNLPPVWEMEEGASSTMVMSRDAIDKMMADQERAHEEIDQLEDSIDSPTLIITSGPDSGQPYKLQESSDTSFWNIGRDATSGRNSIVIDDPSVSDSHAKLVHKGSQWKIVDLMSTNHTFVNDEEYNSRFLASKDAIRFGAVHAVFLLPRAGAGRASATAGAHQGDKPKSLLARLFRWFRS